MARRIETGRVLGWRAANVRGKQKETNVVEIVWKKHGRAVK
jgi:hypothetical protein